MAEKKMYECIIKTLREQDYIDCINVSLEDPIFKDKNYLYVKTKLLTLRTLAYGGKVVDVSKTFMVGKTTINLWGKEYIANGLIGLFDEKRGVKSKFNEDIAEELCQAIRNTPRDYGYDFNMWTVKLVSCFLKDKLNITLQQQTTSFWMHRAKIVLTRPKKTKKSKRQR